MSDRALTAFFIIGATFLIVIGAVAVKLSFSPVYTESSPKTVTVTETPTTSAVVTYTHATSCPPSPSMDY